MSILFILDQTKPLSCKSDLVLNEQKNKVDRIQNK